MTTSGFGMTTGGSGMTIRRVQQALQVQTGVTQRVGGGQVVGVGTPEDIAANPDSHTGRYLKRLLHAPDCHPGPDPGSSATRTLDCGSSPQ